ncbi:uncharacterized protein [Coffea arabica]|uniref:Uncharacterized protein isoform X4 n=1 Tax=Coffea arabica TaxID=13443 RepID=A0ABM4UM54_COFAR
MCSVTTLLQWPTALTGMEMPVIQVQKYRIWLLAKNILAPLPIGFAVFLVQLASIPVTGTGIDPARSLGVAIIFNRNLGWNDHVSKPIMIVSSCSQYLFIFLAK